MPGNYLQNAWYKCLVKAYKILETSLEFSILQNLNSSTYTTYDASYYINSFMES